MQKVCIRMTGVFLLSVFFSLSAAAGNAGDTRRTDFNFKRDMAEIRKENIMDIVSGVVRRNGTCEEALDQVAVLYKLDSPPSQESLESDSDLRRQNKLSDSEIASLREKLRHEAAEIYTPFRQGAKISVTCRTETGGSIRHTGHYYKAKDPRFIFVGHKKIPLAYVDPEQRFRFSETELRKIREAYVEERVSRKLREAENRCRADLAGHPLKSKENRNGVYHEGRWYSVREFVISYYGYQQTILVRQRQNEEQETLSGVKTVRRGRKGRPCPSCNGSGVIQRMKFDDFRKSTAGVKCSTCGGTGYTSR